MFLQKEKNKKLERKHAVHFPRRTLINEKRKPNYKDPNKQPNPILSTKAKTKENQGASQCKGKMFFRTNKHKKNTEHLTLNQSLVLSQSDTLNSKS
jgi:hypothetical protein